MNIELLTVTLISVAKSEADWRQVLVDPAPFQTELRAALAQLHSDPPSAATRAATPRASQRTRETSPKKVQCPICKKTVTPRGLGIHKAKAHPDAPAAD